jgi:hypothetical protein
VNEKKISKRRIAVSPGKYYIEDILEIYKLLTSVSKEVKITTEKYEFENLEEIESHKDQINELSITSYNPYISVEIRTWVIIYTNDDTPLTRGVIEEIADLARDRVKTFNIKDEQPSFNAYTITVLAIPVLLVLSGFLYASHFDSFIVGILTFVCSLLYFVWIWYVTSIRRSTIKLISRLNSPNFFKVNADKIFIAIFAAILGGLINFFISLIGK